MNDVTEKPKRGEVRLGWEVAKEREPTLSYQGFAYRVRMERIDAMQDMLEAKRRALKRQTAEIRRILKKAQDAQAQYEPRNSRAGDSVKVNIEEGR